MSRASREARFARLLNRAAQKRRDQERADARARKLVAWKRAAFGAQR